MRETKKMTNHSGIVISLISMMKTETYGILRRTTTLPKKWCMCATRHSKLSGSFKKKVMILLLTCVKKV